MSSTIEITVSEGSKEPHLSRHPIHDLEDKKTSTYHSSLALNASAVQEMINAFGSNPTSLNFEIGWKPPEAKSLLFSKLKKSKAGLIIYIHWFVRDSGKVIYTRNVVIRGATVSDYPISRGTAPNAIQYVAFSAASFVPSK